MHLRKSLPWMLGLGSLPLIYWALSGSPKECNTRRVVEVPPLVQVVKDEAKVELPTTISEDPYIDPVVEKEDCPVIVPEEINSPIPENKTNTAETPKISQAEADAIISQYFEATKDKEWRR